MGKIKNFMNKPITYGAMFKTYGWSIGLYAALIGAAYVHGLYTDREYYKDKYYGMIGMSDDSDDIGGEDEA